MATTTANNGWTIPQSTDLVSQGATAIATLGNNIDTSCGTGLKAWTAWTPTLTNITLGGGTIAGAYSQLGKIVTFRLKVTLGATGAFTGLGSYSLPVTAKVADAFIVPALLVDAGVNSYPGLSWTTSTTLGVIYAINAAGTYGINTATAAAVPFTWASGDNFIITGSYEAA